LGKSRLEVLVGGKLNSNVLGINSGKFCTTAISNTRSFFFSSITHAADVTSQFTSSNRNGKLSSNGFVYGTTHNIFGSSTKFKAFTATLDIGKIGGFSLGSIASCHKSGLGCRN